MNALNSIMTENSRLRRRFLVAVAIAACMVFVGLVAKPGTASAQAPTGVDGPWLDINQIFWFTAPDYGHVDPGDSYAPHPEGDMAQRFEYAKDRHPQCYYFFTKGPEAHHVNALYMMMSCRMGLVVGVLTWIGISVALMAIAWGGVMRVVDSNVGGERAAALVNMVTGPLIGVGGLLLAYPITKALATIIRYNFERYLRGEGFWG